MERSWLGLEAIQQPEYSSKEDLASALSTLSDVPELISMQECESLKSKLSACSSGASLLLIIGDCAEAYSDCTSSILKKKLKSYSDFLHCLQSSSNKPITLLGRIAGQFCKPRSEAHETINGGNTHTELVPAYKGDLVNSPDPQQRAPDPRRLVQGYYHAAALTNYIRISGLELYTAHEALHLQYENALTRSVEDYGFLNTSAHFVWLGERTRRLGNAHVEYLSRICNPIGVKVGPGVNTEELIQIVTKINPDRETGKVVLITRIGAKMCREEIRRILEDMRACTVPVVWIVDPMHGNTYKTQNGFKTRNYIDIVKECNDTIEVFKEMGVVLAGIMLEASYTQVTEVVGGGITPEVLGIYYTSLCDPRLNYVQAIELLSQVGQKFK